jgi:hypothetical protein
VLSFNTPILSVAGAATAATEVTTTPTIDANSAEIVIPIATTIERRRLFPPDLPRPPFHWNCFPSFILPPK